MSLSQYSFLDSKVQDLESVEIPSYHDQHGQDPDQVKTEQISAYGSVLEAGVDTSKPVQKRLSVEQEYNDNDNVKSAWTKVLSAAVGRKLMPLVRSEHLLTVLSLIGLVVGVALGQTLKEVMETTNSDYWTQRNISYVQFPGELLLRMLNCIQLPLVITSIVAAIASMNGKSCRMVILQGTVFSIVTTMIAAVIGALVTLTFVSILGTQRTLSVKDICNSTWHAHEQFPFCWEGNSPSSGLISIRCILGSDFFMDYLRSVAPFNVVSALIEQFESIPDVSSPANPTHPRYNSCSEYLATPQAFGLETFNLKRQWTPTANMTGAVTIAILMGLCALMVGEQAKSFRNIFISLSEIMLKMASWALWWSPIGICFLMAGYILTFDGPWSATTEGAFFLLIAVIGLALHTVVLLAVYSTKLRASPLPFMKSISPVIVTGFGVSSASWTIPVTIKALEDKVHLDPRIVRFTAPTATNWKSNGRALHVSSCVIFLAATNGTNISFEFVVRVVLLAVLVSLTMKLDTRDLLPKDVVVVLGMVGLPGALTAQIFHIIWLTQKVTVVADVVSDCVCIAVLNEFSERYLPMEMTQEEQEEVMEQSGSVSNLKAEAETASTQSPLSSSMEAWELNSGDIGIRASSVKSLEKLRFSPH